MNVNGLHALTQQFDDAFDQRDLKTVMEMLSEDVEVFDHHRGHHLSELRLPTAIVPRVQRYRGDRECLRHVYGSNEGRQGPIHPRPNYPGLHQAKRAVENCGRPLFCYALGSLTMRQRHPASMEMGHEYK